MTTNTLGSDPAFRPKPATAWLLPFAPMGFAAFSLSALVFFHLRQDEFAVQSALQHAYAAMYRAIGFAPAVMFFGLVILWSTIWLANGALQRPLQRLGRLAAMAVLLGVLLNLGDGGVSPALHKGAIGAAVAQALVSAVGYWPSLVLVWAVTFASLLLATDFFFQESFERLFAAPRADAGPAYEAGVEPLASDRLREVPAAPADVVASNAVAAPAAAADGSESSRRRRSHEERRAEREAMASRWSALAASTTANEAAVDDVEAVTPVVEAAEDALELSAARVVDAIDAATEPANAAVERDVPEALQRGAADDGYAAAAARAQRTPIVFPDEAPIAAAAAGDGAAEVAANPSEPASEPVADGWPAPTAWSPASTADAGELDAATMPTGAGADGDGDDGDDALGLGDEVFVLADPKDPGYAASFGAVAEDDGSEPADDESAPAPVVSGDESTPFAGATDVAAGVEPEPVVDAPSEQDVAIPRPDAATERPASGLDETLVAEAIELVTSSRRANTVFLQRKLRVDYELAAALLAELAARGVVALDAEATHGRVLR